METQSTATQRPLWVLREPLAASLEEAAHAIENFHKDRQNTDALALCAARLHEVGGSLSMLDLDGALALAREMEQLATALADPERLKHQSAFELLIAATLFLPRYLDYVRKRGNENHALLLPTLNLLRFVRRAGLVPEHRFVPFRLPPVHALDVQDPSPPCPDLETRIGPARQRFQIGLIGVIQVRELDTSLKHMTSALEQLDRLCGRQPFCELWWLTEGLLESIADGGLNLEPSVKHILGAVDRAIRDLGREGALRLAQGPEPDLRRALLYYLAKSDSLGRITTAIRLQYQLKGAVSSQGQLMTERRRLEAPDSSVTTAVVSELRETLGEVRARVQLLDHPGYLSRDSRNNLCSDLDQMALTLEMLDLRGAMTELNNMSREISTLPDEADGPLMAAARVNELAERFVWVEQSVEQFAEAEPRQRHRVEIEPAERQAMREARTALAHVKNALDDFLAPFSPRHGEMECVEPVPDHLYEVAGALEVMGLDPLVTILDRCNRFVMRQLLAGYQPDSAQLEALAEALASVEWYLEDFEDHREPEALYLERATEALDLLWVEPESRTMIH